MPPKKRKTQTNKDGSSKKAKENVTAHSKKPKKSQTKKATFVTKNQEQNLLKKGIAVSPVKKRKKNPKSIFDFDNPKYMYSMFSVENVSDAEFEFLKKHIMNSFFYEEDPPAKGVKIYKSLKNTEKEFDEKEFLAELKEKKKTKLFYTAQYRDKKGKLKEGHVKMEKAYLLARMFQNTSEVENFDSKRLSITHFDYDNNPMCANKEFVGIMKRIGQKVVEKARSFDTEFCKYICTILISLPGGEEQEIHIDDVRDVPKDDMLSCIVALEKNTALNFATRTGHKETAKNKAIEKIPIRACSGIIFSGQSCHGGCKYTKLNIRLHYYILKNDVDDTWDIFSGNLRQKKSTCKYCKESFSATSIRQRKAFDTHMRRCKTKEIVKEKKAEEDDNKKNKEIAM